MDDEQRAREKEVQAKVEALYGRAGEEFEALKRDMATIDAKLAEDQGEESVLHEQLKQLEEEVSAAREERDGERQRQMQLAKTLSSLEDEEKRLNKELMLCAGGDGIEAQDAKEEDEDTEEEGVEDIATAQQLERQMSGGEDVAWAYPQVDLRPLNSEELPNGNTEIAPKSEEITEITETAKSEPE